MSALLTVVIAAAAKVGAPIIKDILEKQLGGAVGGIAGTIIDKVAERAGVTPEQIPTLPPGELESAVRAVEAETPALVQAYVEQQRETNRLLLSKDRPKWLDGWQWFLMALWGINGPGIMLANAISGGGLVGIPWDNLMWLTITYQGLNMGGHWSSGLVKTWKGIRP